MACTLKSLLDGVLQRSSEEDWRIRLAKQWSSIVGELHTKMRLECVRHDTLIVGVYDSHWMHELFMLSHIIVATVNKHLGGRYVSKIRFVLADAKEKKVPSKSGPATGQNARRPVMNSGQKNALKAVKDDQLQQALEKFFYRCEA